MKSKISILFAALALIASTLACATGELTLENARMAKDAAGEQAVTAFSPSDTFYVVADLSNATKGTKVSSKWYSVNVPGYETGEISTDTTSELVIEDDYFTGTVNFSLANSAEGWAPGEYKVEVYLNGQLLQSLNFTVQ